MLATVTAVAPHAALLQQALQATRWLARATNWLAWLFSTRSRKANVKSKESGIRKTLLSPQTARSLQELMTGLRKAQQFEVESDAAVADEWRTNYSPLLASLEGLLSKRGSVEERTILDRGLATRFSSDLLERIRRVVLNTSRLVLQLRPYQEFGAKFAVAVHRGLLGDDMGLGKTVQALAAIAHATDAEGQPHHLVVCPASLIDTWLQEIGRALTDIPGWRFHGPVQGNVEIGGPLDDIADRPVVDSRRGGPATATAWPEAEARRIALALTGELVRHRRGAHSPRRCAALAAGRTSRPAGRILAAPYGVPPRPSPPWRAAPSSSFRWPPHPSAAAPW